MITKDTTTILRYFRSNPNLMTLMMTQNRTDLGDGLSVELSHRLFHSKWEGIETLTDILEFTFFLEGVEIGSLDDSMGGGIGDSHRDDYKLMESVVDRMMELFPEVKNEIFDQSAPYS